MNAITATKSDKGLTKEFASEPYGGNVPGQNVDFWGQPLGESFDGKNGQEIRNIDDIDGFILGGAFD